MINDKILKSAAAEADSAILNSLPDLGDCEKSFSIKFESKMKRLIRKSKYKMSDRLLKSIAAVVIIALITSSLIIVFNAEARADFIGWLRELTERTASYTYSDDVQPNNIEKYRPAYIPGGWKETVLDEDETGGTVLYDNGSDEINVFYYLHGGGISVDLNGGEIRNIYIKGNEADLIIYPDSNEKIVVWTEKDIEFLIQAFLSEEEITKMAESVDVLK